MTISGLLEGSAGASAGGPYDSAYEFAQSVIGQVLCDSNLEFFNKDRLPEHILLSYPKFVKFIEIFYQWLSCENEIGTLEVLKDVDVTPDIFVQLFKKIYAAGFPNFIEKDWIEDEESEILVDFINPNLSKVDVRSFLKFSRDLYQLKSTKEAFEYFFRVFYDSDVEVSYPKTWLLRCSDAPYRGVSAGTTGAQCYYWGSTGECPGVDGVDIDPIAWGGCATGPCWTNTSNQYCWAGGSYDSSGNEILPPCDKQGCAPGAPCGVYYNDEFGTLSGFSRLQDSKYWQNYSYLIETNVPREEYSSYLKQLLHPAGMFVGENYSLWDTFPTPGTTIDPGDAIVVETPVIGNYAPYRFQTMTNLRSNDTSVDLYPCGWNPYIVSGSTYGDWHTSDTGNLLYKNEDGLTAHQPLYWRNIANHVFSPIGLTGHTGGTAATDLGVSFFRIFHHPNTWTYEVPSGISMGAVSLGEFLLLSPLNSSTTSPNSPTESSAGCTGS
jgi:hypothetical protein